MESTAKAWMDDVERRDKEARPYIAHIGTAFETLTDRLFLQKIYEETGTCHICGGKAPGCGHNYTRKSPKARNCNACEYHEYCSNDLCRKEVCGADMCVGNLCPECYKKEHGGDWD